MMGGLDRALASRAGSRVVVAVTVCMCLAGGCRKAAPTQGPTPVNEDEARTLDDFQQRVKAYVVVHQRVEATLPKLPKDPTPAQIDGGQREFGRRLADARASAKQGDLMTPAFKALVGRHLNQLFGGPSGAAVKASVMDENPLVGAAVKVNERYPDEVPLSTMPPDLLRILPKMPEELEYRFVGRNLVIMDEHAHLIADFIPGAIPE